MKQNIAIRLLVPLIFALQSGAAAQDPRPAAEGPVLNVQVFGAVADGVTDDYTAIRAAVAAINAAGGGTLHFPPGTYLIDQFRTATNGIGIAFSDCDGLTVDGYGARIVVKGDFHRPADLSATESSVNSVVPIHLVNCRNFTIQGLEVDGNAALTSRDPGVIEGPSHGLITERCSNYTIRDYYAHNFPGDGIYIGDSSTISDRNVLIERVTARFNARDGISVISARDGVIRDSVFEYNGWDQGTYPAHEPMSGINIEASHHGDPDVKTGNWLIEGCTIASNQRSQVQAAGLNKENLTLRQCTVNKGISTYVNTVNLVVPGGVIEDSTLDVEQIVPSWESIVGTSTVFRNNVIRSHYRGITDYVTSVGLRDVLIEGNQFIGTHTAPAVTQMPFIRNASTIFRNNTLFMPSIARNALSRQPISLVSFVKESSGNVYRTDYHTTSGAYFYTDYTGTTPAADEQYPTERYWRRGLNASFSASTQLAFAVEPSGAAEGVPFANQPRVEVLNSDGVRNTSYTGPVSLAIEPGTGTPGATLNGTTTVNAVAGVATFTNVLVSAQGEGFVLRATSGSLFQKSHVFAVGPGAYGLADVTVALRHAAGLSAITPDSLSRYDVESSGSSSGTVDLADAARITRKVGGKDSNP